MPFVVNFGNGAILEFNQRSDNGCTMLGVHLLAFRTLVFLQRLPKIGCVDKDYLIFSFCRFIFVENPQIGDDARIEELVGRHLNNGFDPIVVEKIFADIALATTGVAAEQRRAVVYFYDNTFVLVQVPSVMLQEEHLPVAHGRQERELPGLVVADLFLITFPRYSVGRVGYNDVKLFALERQ